MKRLVQLFSLVFLVAGLIDRAEAQDAPPPPPPAPDQGPTYAPPPPPVAPPQCGVFPAPPCAQPYAQPYPQPYAQPYPQPYYPPPYHRPLRYHPASSWNLGPYVGVGGGGFAVLGAKGPFEYLSSGGFASVYIGMNFARRFALELGFLGSVHNEEWSYEPQSLMLWGVTLDARYNLVSPSWHRRFVPYLQAGVGAYGLVSDNYSGSQTLAQGGGFQLGGGLDIYLARWMTFGARLLYRGVIMGKVNDTCGDRCISTNEADKTYINGLTAELNMSIVF